MLPHLAKASDSTGRRRYAMEGETKYSQSLLREMVWVISLLLVAAVGASAFVIQAPPTDESSGLQAGIALIKRGALSSAEHFFSETIKQDPSSAEAHYWLGIVYLKQKKNDAAEENLRKAVELRPGY